MILREVEPCQNDGSYASFSSKVKAAFRFFQRNKETTLTTTKHRSPPKSDKKYPSSPFEEGLPSEVSFLSEKIGFPSENMKLRDMLEDAGSHDGGDDGCELGRRDGGDDGCLLGRSDGGDVGCELGRRDG